MTIKFMESGSDATQGLEFFDAVSGTVTSTTAQSKTGPRSILTDGHISKDNILTNTGGRVSYWVRPGGTVGAANGGPLISLWDNVTTNNRFCILFASSGNTLILVDFVTQRAAGTIPFTANVWHHVAIAYTRTSSSVNRFKVWVNGVLDIDATNVTWTNPVLNCLFGTGTNTADIPYVDDIYIDDVADLTFPGDIRITAKLPSSLGTNNFDTLGGSGTNRYDRVSDRPLSVTNYIQHAALTDVQENFGVQAAADGDVNISDNRIIGHCGWVYAKRGDYDTKVVRDIGSVQSKT